MGKLELNSNVQYIKGVGEKMAKYLNKLDIYNIYDILTFYPREYEDRRELNTFKELYNEKTVQVVGIAISEVKSIRVRNRMTIQKVVFEIDGGKIEAVWYNNSFIQNMIKKSHTYILYGKIKGAFREL